MTDKFILLPKGKLGFVEVKRKDEKPRPFQISRHRLLKSLGFKVFILNDQKQIKQIIKEITGGNTR